jgi:hypothetical protein
MNAFQFPIFAHPEGIRGRRDAVNEPIAWRPDGDEEQLGPRTDFSDGIYIVTVGEHTPDEWIRLARKATIASHRQHPGPDFLPGDNYDSAVAVRCNRVVGGVLASTESPLIYRWRVSLKPNGNAYSYEELRDAVPGNDPGIVAMDRAQRRFGPAIFTIWVHPAHRSHHTGGQLVRAVAEHFDSSPERIGYRLPLSREAVGMVRSLGLLEIVGCF